MEPTLQLGDTGEQPREEEVEQLLHLHLGVWELLCQPCSITLINPAPPFLNEQLIGACLDRKVKKTTKPESCPQ